MSYDAKAGIDLDLSAGVYSSLYFWSLYEVTSFQGSGLSLTLKANDDSPNLSFNISLWSPVTDLTCLSSRAAIAECFNHRLSVFTAFNSNRIKRYASFGLTNYNQPSIQNQWDPTISAMIKSNCFPRDSDPRVTSISKCSISPQTLDHYYSFKFFTIFYNQTLSLCYHVFVSYRYLDRVLQIYLPRERQCSLAFMQAILSNQKKFYQKSAVRSLKLPLWQELSLDNQWNEAI